MPASAASSYVRCVITTVHPVKAVNGKTHAKFLGQHVHLPHVFYMLQYPLSKLSSVMAFFEHPEVQFSDANFREKNAVSYS
jgi:hypothetical protein